MRKFLLDSGLFVLLLVSSMLTVFLSEGGYSDSFYLRFTTPKQASLIIGTSRAAQGLMPAVLNDQLSGVTSYPIFNYAFTVFNSPYGEAYFSSIKRKISNSEGGVFILTVDPWSVATGNDNDDLPESENFLANVSNVSINPNLEYLLNFYPKSFINIIRYRLIPSNKILHKDGWLEINLSMDSVEVARRTKRQLRRYEEKIGTLRLSELRLEYLVKTILLLKGHGSVFMVRMPVGKEMASIEKRAMPRFDIELDSICRQHNVKLFNFIVNGANFRYTDGHHLQKLSSESFSEELSRMIVKAAEVN